MKLMIFPIAFMTNSFAMMLIMIGLSLFGKPEIAADFGLIHGASVAVFYSFSGNARNLILANPTSNIALKILRFRLVFLLPLGIVALLFSIGVVDGGLAFAVPLILRRGFEWLAEIHLSIDEVKQETTSTVNYILAQLFLILTVLLGILSDKNFTSLVLWIWAVSPLFLFTSLKLFKEVLSDFDLSLAELKLLPHFGSTIIIGLSVYIFRLVLLLITGKEISGDLFAAFSIGGLLGAVFSQALGPTINFNKSLREHNKLNLLLRFVVISLATVGLSLIIAIHMYPSLLAWTLKSNLFWSAIGSSLIGSAVMIYAQIVRLRIIQNDKADVFGSDLLANALLISSIPFIYFWLGLEYLGSLYLIGALLSMLFYSSETNGLAPASKLNNNILLYLIVIGLFSPLFFQLSGGIYSIENSYHPNIANLSKLPIPISAIACYLALILLGKYSEARQSLLTLFFTIVAMIFATVTLSIMKNSYDQSKFIMLIQFILPMFALIVGQQFGKYSGVLNFLPKIFMGILIFFVTLQLTSTFTRGLDYLSPSVFLFIIYQHLQYIPVIFVSLFLFILFSREAVSKYGRLIPFLAAIMGAYAILSASMLAIGLLIIGTIGNLAHRYLTRNNHQLAINSLLIIACSFFIVIAYFSGLELLRSKFGISVSMSQENEMPLNVSSRITYWNFYISEIFSGVDTFTLGHLKAPDRQTYPSAHNYFLDFIYNFGFIALLPLLALISLTFYKVIRRIKFVWANSEVLCLVAIVFFLLLVDNSLKVGLRQPYPGIISFFLWGVLLSVLTNKNQSLES